jgi:glucose/arabinose dehydrogenase
MKRKRFALIWGLVVLTACGLIVAVKTAPALAPTPAPSATSTAAAQSSVPYKVTPVITGLQVPWSLVFPSAKRWLVSERSGALRVIEDGKLLPQPLTTFTVSNRSEEGLMGLALDPDFAKNRLVYACYAYNAGDDLRDRVVRFTDQGSTAGPPTTIIDGIPAAQNHAGCRLSFGPQDKKLYVTTGDALQRNEYPQNLKSLGGKILRLNPDGSVPANNPFAGSPVWSYGHRNPQGLAWQPGTGRLYETEHGPSGNDGPPGGDEVNLIQKGANYGWPIVSHDRTDPRFVSPLQVYTPAVAPSGATFYTGNALPQFTGHLFFAALKGAGLYHLVIDPANPAHIASQEKLSDVNIGRIRAVEPGPDGALYLLTSNRDGRGAPQSGDDHIYRLGP